MASSRASPRQAGPTVGVLSLRAGDGVSPRPRGSAQNPSGTLHLGLGGQPGSKVRGRGPEAWAPGRRAWVWEALRGRAAARLRAGAGRGGAGPPGLLPPPRKVPASFVAWYPECPLCLQLSNQPAPPPPPRPTAATRVPRSSAGRAPPRAGPGSPECVPPGRRVPQPGRRGHRHRRPRSCRAARRRGAVATPGRSLCSDLGSASGSCPR